MQWGAQQLLHASTRPRGFATQFTVGSALPFSGALKLRNSLQMTLEPHLKHVPGKAAPKTERGTQNDAWKVDRPL